MTEHPDPDRVQRRAHELNPEELAVGSDDPEAQAEAILADSDERTEHPERAARESTQTPD
ncbi:MAG TPA: hypothetical protein VMB79_04590 [Jatrophihabitans sp.]|nr:hypothetical protein [Jatrophihabitans sp.]